mgnify:CR=1 FL=1
MTLMGHHLYGAPLVERNKMKILKKNVWKNNAGDVQESSSNDLPKGWAKGKLLGIAGQEVSDAQLKEWGLASTKAKAPQENKAKS